MTFYGNREWSLGSKWNLSAERLGPWARDNWELSPLYGEVISPT